MVRLALPVTVTLPRHGPAALAWPLRGLVSRQGQPCRSHPVSQTMQRLQPIAEHRPARPVADGVRIGHVHLKVADLERALSFYCGVLGFELMQKRGNQAAFVSAGGYHHHIGLNTWDSLGGKPPPPGSTGLYHVAILYPTRALLADAFRRVLAAG